MTAKVLEITDVAVGKLIRNAIKLGWPLLTGAGEGGIPLIFLVPGDGWPDRQPWSTLFRAERPGGVFDEINANMFCSVETKTVWYRTERGWLDSRHACGLEPVDEDCGKPYEPEPRTCPPLITLPEGASRYLIGLSEVEAHMLGYVDPNGDAGTMHLAMTLNTTDQCYSQPSNCASNLPSGYRCKRNTTGPLNKGKIWRNCNISGQNVWKPTTTDCDCT